jgi:hypothetical protein
MGWVVDTNYLTGQAKGPGFPSGDPGPLCRFFLIANAQGERLYEGRASAVSTEPLRQLGGHEIYFWTAQLKEGQQRKVVRCRWTLIT